MDLSPEVCMMSMDEMSSTSRSPDHYSDYGDYVEYSQACMYMSGAQDYRVVHSSMHRCIP